MKIGFIGTGVMGRSMAGHLLRAGHELTVHSRTKAKAATLLEQGVPWADSLAQVAEKSDLIITMLGFPEDVEAVYLGDDGLLDHSRPDQIWIDMTTSRPSLAEEIHKQAHTFGVSSLDAPVSGGDVGAREARLSIMVGGRADTFQQCLPVLQSMGRSIVYQGPAGAGQHAKMCNQIIIASTMMGMCEAIAYGRVAGLDPLKMLESIGSGAAASWTLTNLAPRILKGDFNPGFYIKHFVKDMTIAIQESFAMGLDTPGLQQALELYETLLEKGCGEEGTQALYKWYSD